MLEICLNSEIEGELIKIKRKSSMGEFCSYVIQELAFTFVLISLPRKHSLQLPRRSLISNQPSSKKRFLIVGKFENN